MSQESFDYGRLYRVEEEHRKAFRALEAATESVSLIVAAGAAGMESSDLSKTFSPNSGRHLRLRTTMAIGAVAGVDSRRAILLPIARSLGFDIQELKPIDDKTARIRLEAALKALGPLGEQAFYAAMGER